MPISSSNLNKCIARDTGMSAQDFIIKCLAERGPLKIYTGHKTTLMGRVLKTGEIVILSSECSLIGLKNKKYTTIPADKLFLESGVIHTLTETGQERYRKIQKREARIT